MVDLGFEEELTYILEALPAGNEKPAGIEVENVMEVQPAEGDQAWRVTTLFSATMPPAVERLTKQYLSRPAIVTIGVAGQDRSFPFRFLDRSCAFADDLLSFFLSFPQAVETVEQRTEFVAGDQKKKSV